MKLDVEVNEIVLSNVGATGEFRIRNSAKAFSILSSGLYSNKIKAIIRELSTNALDSHVAAGKADVPFEVHLPTMLEPWFSVRDFGVGLDNNQVVNIYTTYFESTKTDSNDYIGALGLGSKSPFSYTENFTVTAIKNGTKRIYSAFINDMGVPSIAEMNEELTDENNGVEVKFSVTDRYDYNSFNYESQEVFKWFKNKPIVTGVKFEHTEVEYKEKNIVPGVHIIKNGSSIALMGNIAYPLNNISEPTKHFGDLADLLCCNLVFEFNIGELDFAASREELSYVPITINSIRRKLTELNANLATHLAEKANAIEHEWDRAEFLCNESTSNLYSSAVNTYVINTNFPLYDTSSYRNKKIFKCKITDLNKRNLSINAFSVSYGRTRDISASDEYRNGSYEKIMPIPVESSVVIVLNDLKTRCVSRASYHFSKLGLHKTVFCISHSDKDTAVRQVEYDKFLKELHNPPTVIKASSLNKKEVVKRKPLSNNGISQLINKETSPRSRYGRVTYEYKWEPYSETIDSTKKYYYVCLNKHISETIDGVEFDVELLKTLMDNSNIDDIKNITIMGVRKSRIKEIKSAPNWIWVEDKIKEEIDKVSDNDIISLVAGDILDHWSLTYYTSTDVAKYVGKNSDYAKFVKESKKIPRSKGNLSNLLDLCKRYGKIMQADTAMASLNDSKALIMAKYPLIKYLNSAESKEIAEYINLIDNQQTI